MKATRRSTFAREVLVPVVDCMELAAIDGNARCRKQTHLAA
jgi:hypothetical protein